MKSFSHYKSKSMSEQGTDLRMLRVSLTVPAGSTSASFFTVGVGIRSRRPTSDQDFDVNEDLGLDWDIFKF